MHDPPLRASLDAAGSGLLAGYWFTRKQNADSRHKGAHGGGGQINLAAPVVKSMKVGIPLFGTQVHVT